MTTHKDSQFAYKGEVIRCHACASQQRVAKKFADEGGDTTGILVRFTATPPIPESG